MLFGHAHATILIILIPIWAVNMFCPAITNTLIFYLQMSCAVSKGLWWKCVK